MATPFIGEIRLLGCNFAPQGWQVCDGRLLAISEYDTLYVLIGTTYGGDGVTTFGLPDLRGRLPLGQGQGPGLSNRVIGEIAGVESVTLTTQQIPSHNHTVIATTGAATTGTPGTDVIPGSVAGQTMYVTNLTGAMPFTASAPSVSTVGGTQPHENCMPSLGITYCIALFGIFPSQN
jgi:microcystin-dependent protein